VAWREQVAIEKKRAHLTEDYWGKAVPNFGDPNAKHLIVGLAPAAHGANRTGRMFTGDRSGDWLYRALHRAGVANQPNSDSANDGLELRDVLITAVCHCAPPDNKPETDEITNCRPFLTEILRGAEWSGILCLGGLAWQQVFRLLGEKAPKFGHGVGHDFNGTRIVGSYHPSQQNTFTGRLTEPMLDRAIQQWLGQTEF
jgi:uracil-DNA glycosylase family 4